MIRHRDSRKYSARPKAVGLNGAASIALFRRPQVPPMMVIFNISLIFLTPLRVETYEDLTAYFSFI